MFGNMFRAVSDIVTSPIDITNRAVRTVAGNDNMVSDVFDSVIETRDDIFDEIQETIEDMED